MTRRALLAALLLLAAGGAQAQALRGCVVSGVEGPDAQLFDGSVWRPLGEGVPALGPAAAIRTGRATRVEVSCDDDVTLTLAPGTEVSLAGLAGPAGFGSSVALRLLRGLIGAVIPTGGFYRFEITTPSLIASVRGTSWAVSYGPEGAALFVRDGAVGAVTRDAATTLVAGQGIDVSPDGVAGPVATWSAARAAALRDALGFGWR